MVTDEKIFAYKHGYIEESYDSKFHMRLNSYAQCVNKIRIK